MYGPQSGDISEFGLCFRKESSSSLPAPALGSRVILSGVSTQRPRVIRALPGEIRAEKPQDLFGDFFLNKEGGSRSQMVVDSRECGWPWMGSTLHVRLQTRAPCEKTHLFQSCGHC